MRIILWNSFQSRLRIVHQSIGTLEVKASNKYSQATNSLARLQEWMTQGQVSSKCFDEAVYLALEQNSLLENETAFRLSQQLDAHGILVFRSNYLCLFAAKVECAVEASGLCKKLKVEAYRCIQVSAFGRGKISSYTDWMITAELPQAERQIQEALKNDFPGELRNLWPPLTLAP